MLIPAKPLFDNANFELDTSWRLGLLGRNGRGKTTLFKLLQNKLSYTGTLNVSVPLAYFPQPLGDQTKLALYCLQETGNFLEWELKRELKLFKISEDLLWQPFNTLSGGEQTKLMLCALFCQADHFFLLDEPTNHLDLAGRKELVAYLKQKKQGFIIASHDRTFLNQTIDHTLVIERSQVRLENGDLASYEMQKKRRDSHDIQQNAKTRHELKRLKQAALTKENWASQAERQKQNNSHADKGFIGRRATKVMKRATALKSRAEEQIKQKETQLKNLEVSEPLSLNYRPTHKQVLVEAKDFTLAYEKQLFSPLNFEVKAGEIVVLKGNNGSGKTSLFQALLKSSKATVSGELSLNTQNISVVRQNFSTDRGTLKEFAQKRELDYTLLLTLLKKLGFERHTFDVLLENMSLGQQKKVQLAASLATPAELYLWDEPLNYLDTYNQDQLLTLLQETKPALLVIEHDQNFIDQIADTIVKLK